MELIKSIFKEDADMAAVVEENYSPMTAMTTMNPGMDNQGNMMSGMDYDDYDNYDDDDNYDDEMEYNKGYGEGFDDGYAACLDEVMGEDDDSNDGVDEMRDESVKRASSLTRLVEKVTDENKHSEVLVEAESVANTIGTVIDTDWGGSNEEQMKAVQMLKFLSTSDDPLANKFMAQLDSATSKMSKDNFKESVLNKEYEF